MKKKTNSSNAKNTRCHNKMSGSNSNKNNESCK